MVRAHGGYGRRDPFGEVRELSLGCFVEDALGIRAFVERSVAPFDRPVGSKSPEDVKLHGIHGGVEGKGVETAGLGLSPVHLERTKPSLELSVLPRKEPKLSRATAPQVGEEGS